LDGIVLFVLALGAIAAMVVWPTTVLLAYLGILVLQFLLVRLAAADDAPRGAQFWYFSGSRICSGQRSCGGETMLCNLNLGLTRRRRSRRDQRRRGMRRLDQACLALSLSVVAVLPAHAQVTIDVSKITCEQYILFTVANPHDIAVWLSGYYNAKRNNTVIDTQELREHARKVTDYCELNLKLTVMDAVEKVLELKR
jgi:hypothetical protein